VIKIIFEWAIGLYYRAEYRRRIFGCKFGCEKDELGKCYRSHAVDHFSYEEYNAMWDTFCHELDDVLNEWITLLEIS